jgi:hypothetical protein
MTFLRKVMTLESIQALMAIQALRSGLAIQPKETPIYRHSSGRKRFYSSGNTMMMALQ